MEKEQKPLPPDLETWLAEQPASEREALRQTWHLLNNYTISAMNQNQLEQNWQKVAVATTPQTFRLSWWRAAAAALVLLIAGWGIGRLFPAPGAGASAQANPEKPRFALLVKADDVPPADGMQQFREYSAWVGGLKKERWAGGEALHGKAWRLHKNNGAVEAAEHTLQTTPDEISGYFLFEADNAEEALKIAQTCPHLNYQGTLELREIFK